MTHGMKVIALAHKHSLSHVLSKSRGVDNIDTQPMLPSEAAIYAAAYKPVTDKTPSFPASSARESPAGHDPAHDKAVA